MMKEDLITILILGGAIAAWMLLIAFLAEREKRSQKNGRYDERQVAAQGSAFKWGFFTMMAYDLQYGLLSAGLGLVWCEPVVGSLLGVLLGSAVYCMICILRDAYLRPTDSRTMSLVSINLLAACQLFLYFSNYSSEPPIQNGILKDSSVQLLFVVEALLIDLTFFIRSRMEKREEQHEEPEA